MKIVLILSFIHICLYILTSYVGTSQWHDVIISGTNTLAPRRFEGHFRWMFEVNLVIGDWAISLEIALR